MGSTFKKFSFSRALDPGGFVFQDKPPKPAKPVVQPLPDEEAIRRAKQDSILDQTARSGRESTVLTNGGSSTLG